MLKSKELHNKKNLLNEFWYHLTSHQYSFSSNRITEKKYYPSQHISTWWNITSLKQISKTRPTIQIHRGTFYCFPHLSFINHFLFLSIYRVVVNLSYEDLYKILYSQCHCSSVWLKYVDNIFVTCYMVNSSTFSLYTLTNTHIISSL